MTKEQAELLIQVLHKIQLTLEGLEKNTRPPEYFNKGPG